LVNVHNGVPNAFAGNPHVPQNLHLLCGDRSLDLLVDELAKRAAAVGAVTSPYR
jgi:hypothetical protein